MLRLHLSAEDLLRTRFASAPSPLPELTLALAALQRHDVLFDSWRRDLTRRMPAPARLLLQLVPPTATSPLFLDPVSDGFEDGLGAVLSTPTTLVRRDLREAFPAPIPPPWVRALYERDAEAWRQLAAAVGAGYQAAIRDTWPRIWQSFRADIAWRGRLIAQQGLRNMLAGLHPGGRWRGTTLEFDAEVDLAVRPAGRGVTLLPSAFWTGRPMVATHPDGSLLVVYASLTPLPLVDVRPGEGPLADLLGRTRAALLGLAVAGRTTGELARELAVSAGAVSQHTATLRRVGLLASERTGKAVLHTVTSLGDRLLAEAGQLPHYLSAPVPSIADRYPAPDD